MLRTARGRPGWPPQLASKEPRPLTCANAMGDGASRGLAVTAGLERGEREGPARSRRFDGQRGFEHSKRSAKTEDYLTLRFEGLLMARERGRHGAVGALVPQHAFAAHTTKHAHSWKRLRLPRPLLAAGDPSAARLHEAALLCLCNCKGAGARRRRQRRARRASVDKVLNSLIGSALARPAFFLQSALC